MKAVSKKLLAAIAQLGGSVPKTGWNNYSKYHYVTEADINNAVLPALLKQGLLLTTSVETVKEEVSTADQKNRFASVVLLHKIIDTDSGEILEFKSTGTGADTLDKAVYKAYTGACKYFLMKLFLLSGDSDPENDGATPPAQDTKPAQGLSKPGLAKPTQAAPALAKPAQQGFMAKKAAEAAPAPAQTGAKKPSFGTKKPETQPTEQPAEAAEVSAEEQDAAY